MALPSIREKPRTLIDQITERIYARIVRQGLVEGDILGTERELAADFGVAYGTLRMSISRLRALGILAGTPRRGLVIKRAKPVDVFGQVLPFAVARNKADDMEQLLQFRTGIELGALEYAVERVDEEILAAMEKTLDPFETLQRQGRISEADAYDVEFHSLILQASKNEMLAGLYWVISDYFIKIRQRFPMLAEQARPEWTGDHRRLVDALRVRDRQLAFEILRHHLRGFSLSVADQERKDEEA